MRWLIAAVAAVGLMLFGSTAFTEGNPLVEWKSSVGILLAAVGLALVLRAATLVFEPEDASLGELAADFKRVGDCKGWWRRWGPRTDAMCRLKRIIEHDEKSAHLGYPHKTVAELIESIGEGEKRRTSAARELAKLRLELASAEHDRGFIQDDLATVLAIKEGLGDKSTQELEDALRQLLKESSAVRTKAEELSEKLAGKQSALLRIDQPLGVDLLHRSLVLNEAG